VLQGVGQSQGAEEVTEIVGEGMQLQANGVVGELPAGEKRPLDGVLAPFNMQLRRAALIVERDNTRGRPGEIGHDEPKSWIEFARMPIDLGDNPAGFSATGTW